MLALELDTSSAMSPLDFSKMCRVCRDESDCMLDLFVDLILPSEEQEPSLAQMLSKCSGCPVDKADGFPQFVCAECAMAIKQAFRLRQQCWKSMQYFSQLRGMQPECIEEPDSEDVEHSQETSKAMEAEEEASHGDESNLEPLIVELVASQCPGRESSSKESTELYDLDDDCSSESISLDSSSEEKNTRDIKRIRSYSRSSSDDSWIPSLIKKPAKKVKNYQCTQCTRSFTQKGNLQAHIRVHTGERPFKCSHCPQTFKQQSHLDVHRRGHTSKRPFKCTHCSYSCNQSTRLNNHIKAVH